ncbi:MAG: MBL fold metallo-hydrolase [Rhodospirillales bacterium]|nr:MBL fold metallo-hydrolase [Rhodospirillales bacterium]MBO6788268.1 MBL fold metallo-hydrolase [Rhodospirillales bacterium]
MFEFEAVKARHGDALLLHADGSLIMVDGGPSSVYGKYLRKRLENLRDGSAPLKIDLLMVSHIDDDHIRGVLDMTDELVDARLERRAPIADIRNLWHNSFSDGLIPPPSAAAVATSGTADDAMELASLDPGGGAVGAALQESTRFVLASVRQGRSLRRNAGILRLRTNAGFADDLVMRDGNAAVRKRVGRFTLNVLAPVKRELTELRKKWKRDLKKILDPDTPRVASLELAANLDKSVANLSSLVIEVKASGKSALLTGDARSDHIMVAMSDVGWPDDGKWPVDLLKVPHHGSNRNATEEFFARVPARHYVISGDGKHGNPDAETMDMIFRARGNDAYTIHLTYSPDEMREDDEFEWRDFKRVVDRHDGWQRLRHPSANSSSLKIKLAR